MIDWIRDLEQAVKEVQAQRSRLQTLIDAQDDPSPKGAEFVKRWKQEMANLTASLNEYTGKIKAMRERLELIQKIDKLPATSGTYDALLKTLKTNTALFSKLGVREANLPSPKLRPKTK